MTVRKFKIVFLDSNIRLAKEEVELIKLAFSCGEQEESSTIDELATWDVSFVSFDNDVECLRFLRTDVGNIVLLPCSIQYYESGRILQRFIDASDTCAVLLVAKEAVSSSEIFALTRQGIQGVMNISLLSTVEIRNIIMATLGRLRSRRDLASESRQRSDFIARMSHEIRTPITSILGFAEVLQDENLTFVERERAASAIVRNSKFLLSLVDDVLDFSQIEAGGLSINMDVVSLPVILADVYELLHTRAVEKGLQLIIEPLFPLPIHIETDAIRLEQILLNLCGNAIKFSFEGEVRVRVHFEPDANKLVFCIKDNGIGIEVGKLGTLFEPFVQADNTIRRDFGGSGLGLAICRSLTEALGGEISACSELGKGSEFVFMVDVGEFSRRELVMSFPSTLRLGVKVASEDNRDLRYKMHGAYPKFKGRVLVVEDFKDTQDLINFYLRRSGVSCDVVSNGAEALDILTRENFDLIFMDMHMPVMDGFTAVEILKKNGFNKPVIAFTASITDDCRRRCIGVGCDDILKKPFTREDVVRVLENYLERSKIETLESRIESLRTDPTFLLLVDKFKTGLPARVKRICDSLESNLLDDVKDLSHRLVSAEMFGFVEVSHLARQIEECAATGNTIELAKKVNRLSTLVSEDDTFLDC